LSTLEARVAALEAQVARLQQQREAQGDGWERVGKRIDRLGDSRGTIERQIRQGILEKKREGGRVYVRERRRPKPRHSSSENVAHKTRMPAIAGAPLFPFSEEAPSPEKKEPSPR
jgi:hypothetical protein